MEHFNPLHGNWFFVHNQFAYDVFDWFEEGRFPDLTLEETIDRMFGVNLETGWLPKLREKFALLVRTR